VEREVRIQWVLCPVLRLQEPSDPPVAFADAANRINLFSLMMIIAVAYIREKKQNLERSRESNK
jgi:hypothetical protein